jgi:2,3-bisphosphoglycerate-dependent phosphoglycerate mutase
MQFYFIRHGQSENNLLWEETGESKGRNEDPELTEKGILQAQALARFLVGMNAQASDFRNRDVTRDHFHFTHFYTSLMVRSVKTASTISEALQIPLHAWPELHECGGIYMDDEETHLPVGMPGKTRSYFAQHYRNLCLPEKVAENGWYNRPYETELDRPVRAKKVLQTLIERHGGTQDRVAVVSHGAFYNEIVRVLFNVQNDGAWFLMNNTGISRFDFWEENRVNLVYHNRTEHLQPGLLS